MKGKFKRTTTAEAVVNYIKDQIRNGSFKPGDTLPSERTLIDELGISRLSLREGLARLTALGIIRVRQGKGAFVNDNVSPETLHDILFPVLSNPNLKSFEDLFEARIFLESFLAAKAAERRKPEDIDSLKGIIEKYEEALGDPKNFANLDNHFHREISRIANNGILLIMEAMIHKTVEEFIQKNVKDLDTRIAALKAHKAILHAVSVGDSAAAARETERHIRGCEEDYKRHFNLEQ